LVLVYAFLDDAGCWHGQADTEVGSPRPKTAIVKMPTEVASPFAGQTLLVKYAHVPAGQGGTLLALDNGQYVHPTAAVERALYSDDPR
jgi:hypothetical protein